jgi:hypothetical protein
MAMSHAQPHRFHAPRRWIACTAAVIVICGGIGVWRLAVGARSMAARTADL